MKRFFLIALLLLANPALSKTIVSEDFDDEPDGTWINDGVWNGNYCNFSYSCQVLPSPQDKPGKAFKATYIVDNCNVRVTNGDELRSQSTEYFEGVNFWIGFRMYINSNTFGYDSGRMILYQYHGYRDEHLDGACGYDGESNPIPDEWRSPPYALQYFEGEWEVDWRGCRDFCTPNNSCPSGFAGREINLKLGYGPIMDAWNDVVIMGRLAWTNQDGHIYFWINGELAYSATNIYLGWNDDETPGYHKIGHYNWSCISDDPTRESFYDDVTYCTGNDCVYSDVMPVGGTIPAGQN